MAIEQINAIFSFIYPVWAVRLYIAYFDSYPGFLQEWLGWQVCLEFQYESKKEKDIVFEFPCRKLNKLLFVTQRVPEA